MAIKIALVGKKGGIGKTISAVSLSASLGRRGYRTLLIDTDSQGSAGQNLGYKVVDASNSNIKSLSDCLYNEAVLSEVIYKTHRPQLDIVLAADSLVKMDMYYASYSEWPFILTQLLIEVESMYDFIVLDTPPALSMITTNVLLACDGFVIPQPPRHLDIWSLRGFLNNLKEIRCLGPIGRLYGVLLTRIARYKTITEGIKELEDLFELGKAKLLFEARINESVKVTECATRGLDVYSHSKRSQPAKAYEQFATELLERI